MKSLLKFAVVALLVASAAAFAADNAMKARISDGAGGSAEAVFGSKDLTTYIVPKHTLVDQDGNEILGQKDEAKSTATDTTSVTIMQVLKQISASVQSTAASLVDTATGAAPPSTANYIAGNGSGATGGLIAGIKTCDSHAKYEGADSGKITMVTGVSGRKVYICGYVMATGGTATDLTIVEGSDANCTSNEVELTPTYVLVANDKIGVTSAFWNGLATNTNAYYVCIKASAANTHQAQIYYTIQ
jgi:hypothetical protein